MTQPPSRAAAPSSAVGVRHDQARFSHLSDIEKALHLELTLARNRLRRASRFFQHATEDLPSGLPEPDASLVIKQAGREFIQNRTSMPGFKVHGAEDGDEVLRYLREAVPLPQYFLTSWRHGETGSTLSVKFALSISICL